MNPVNAWRWEAGTPIAREYRLTGLGTETLRPSESQRVSAHAVYGQGQWRVVMKRPLDDQFDRGQFIPIALAAWDGSNGDTGGKCSVSAWHYLLLEIPDRQIPPPSEPVRVIHPPPPIDYLGLANPLRTDEENFSKHVEEGAELYFENCFFCHGDKLDGQGHLARGLIPAPADFTDPETIGVLKDFYVFWRIMEGGHDLPPESRPWDSAMPAWKDELSEDEIWKIILYLFETVRGVDGPRRSP